MDLASEPFKNTDSSSRNSKFDICGGKNEAMADIILDSIIWCDSRIWVCPYKNWITMSNSFDYILVIWLTGMYNHNSCHIQ